MLANGQHPAPQRYQVLIHEILADPSPSAGLPAYEFVELRNVGAFPVDLKGWTLRSGSQRMKLPEYLLQADSVAVISSRPVFSPGISGPGFPALNNEGDTISLYDAQGTWVHAVAYNKSWYQGSIKDNGGWSLEMVDAQWPCAGAQNWKPSTSATGGTPGKHNAVAGRITEPPVPEIIRISVPDSMQLLLHFSGMADSASAAITTHYGIENVAAATPLPPMFSTVLIRLSKALEAGRPYTLQTHGITDCTGRPVTPAAPIPFALPVPPAAGDLVINEVLFDPLPGAVDFVEVFNRSSKALELYPLHFASRGEDGQLKQAVPLVAGPYLLLPGAYLAFTENVPALCRAYACKGALQPLPALPVLPDDAGNILLLHPHGEIIDAFAYDKSFHLGTLPATRGISLERLDPGQPAQDAQNWHSASSAAGYATPGYVNSQLQQGGPEVKGAFSLYPAKFSPDNNGQDDVAAISWQLPAPGYTATILVLDAQGRQVKHLAGNLLLGNSGKVYWDGLNDQKLPAPPGIYVIFIRIFNLSGRVRTWKLALVLDRA